MSILGKEPWSTHIGYQQTDNKASGMAYATTGFGFGVFADASHDTGRAMRRFPPIGHLVTVVGKPKDGLQSGNFWFAIENQDNVPIYQCPATLSGDVFTAFPDTWYPRNAKFVAYTDTGAFDVHLYEIVVSQF